MWPFRRRREFIETSEAELSPSTITLLASDTMHQRVEKALRYAGFVNPNRLGTVDSVAFIMNEYNRLYDSHARRALGEKE